MRRSRTLIVVGLVGYLLARIAVQAAGVSPVAPVVRASDAGGRRSWQNPYLPPPEKNMGEMHLMRTSRTHYESRQDRF